MKTLCIVALAALAGAAQTVAPLDRKPSEKVIQSRLVADYARLPMSFELNTGQADPTIRALARGSNYGVFLTPSESIINLSPAAGGGSLLRWKLVDSNPRAKISGLEPLPGIVDYYIGNDPAKWHRGIQTYGKIQFRGVYPGVDLIYYGNQQQLEYDFLVSPGTSPGVIRLSIQGAKKVHIDARGDLVLRLNRGTVTHHKPVIYQRVNGVRQEIAGNYILAGVDQVSFQIGRYDRTRELIIDPSLAFSTYLGGTGGDVAKAVAVDSLGLIYVAGVTSSTVNFPVGSISPAPPPPQPKFGGGATDAFVTVLNMKGTAAILSTYLGGSGTDQATGIALDKTSPIPNVYVCGLTNSADFPTMATPGPVLQSTLKGGFDAFVVKFAPLSGMIYSTLLGGTGNDLANGIAADSSGNALVTGTTLSITDFPLVDAIQPAYGGGGTDAFVSKINATGTALLYSTYLGGSASENAAAIAADINGNAYVAGTTTSTNFPATGAMGAPGFGHTFVTALTPSGAQIYSVMLAADRNDIAKGIAVDSSNCLGPNLPPNCSIFAYVAGTTNSTLFPVLNAFQPLNAGDYDIFITKLDPSGSTVFSTYYGGPGHDVPSGIAVNTIAGTPPVTSVFIGGSTNSPLFPTKNSFQAGFGGASDGFVLDFAGDGSVVNYSSFIGASGNDVVNAIAVGFQGNATVVGSTNSVGFPVTPGVLQPSLKGATDAFVAKITTLP